MPDMNRPGRDFGPREAGPILPPPPASIVESSGIGIMYRKAG